MGAEQYQSRDRQGASQTTASNHVEPNGPLAYFLTFTCYGTWLHGDERGSVDRVTNSRVSAPLEPNQRRVEYERHYRLQGSPFKIGAAERGVIEAAIDYACRRRSWNLLAMNVRTNHLHVVVSGEGKPESMLVAFKAWSTRRLSERGLIPRGRRIWTRHGSTQYLWTEKDVAGACWSVTESQGSPLPRSQRPAENAAAANGTGRARSVTSNPSPGGRLGRSLPVAALCDPSPANRQFEATNSG